MKKEEVNKQFNHQIHESLKITGNIITIAVI